MASFTLLGTPAALFALNEVKAGQENLSCSTPDGGDGTGGTGTYAFKVTATSGATNASLDLTLIVQ